MSIGFVPPAGPGGFPWFMGEPFSGDPSVSPGLARPIGWEVRAPDGTGAWFKTGPVDTDWTPFNSLGGAKYLNDVYANGLVDPQLHEVMHMPHADLRFLGQNPGYPGFVYLESNPNNEADSRFGAEYYGRYYPTAQGVGGFAVREVAGFDPLWGGAFTGLGGLQIVDIYGFRRVNDPSNPGIDLAIGQQRWAEVHGFFDGPIAYPTPGFNSGASEHLWIDLWNDFTGGFFNHPALDLNGYGQPTFNVISKAQGVITAALNLSWWNGPSPFALDGPGIFFTNGTADPPLGIIANRLLDAAGTNGPTQLAFYTSASAGTLNGPIATMDWRNGIQFNAPFFGHFAGLQISTVIDFTVAGDTTIIPAKPGFSFVPIGSTAGVMLMYTTDGATAGPNISIGNNGFPGGTTGNVVAAISVSQPTGAAFTTLPARANVQEVAIGSVIDLAAPMVLRVNTGATGGPLAGRVLMFGAILPTSDIS